jgi:hypothetical protein
LIDWNWLSVSDKFEVLRIALFGLGNYKFPALKRVCELVISNLFPEGISFVSSLIVSEQTRLCGLSLVCCGVAKAVFGEIRNKDIIRHFPRILHFLKISLDHLKVVVQVNEFQIEIAKFVLFCLVQISSIPQKAAVVFPACVLLRTLDRTILEFVFENHSEKVPLFEAVKSPKQRKAPEILLRAFSESTPRSDRATRSGWQSLEVSDD